jgi:hypothetical protein
MVSARVEDVVLYLIEQGKNIHMNSLYFSHHVYISFRIDVHEMQENKLKGLPQQ